MHVRGLRGLKRGGRGKEMIFTFLVDDVVLRCWAPCFEAHPYRPNHSFTFGCVGEVLVA